MPLVCPICRDILEGSCLENKESDLVAGECGHIFHKTCLCRWIENGNSANSNRCPCCRGNVSVSKFIALFPTSCNDISSTDVTDDLITLKSTIDDQNEMIKSLKDTLELKQLRVEDLSKQIDDLETKNKKLEAANKVWMDISGKKDFYKKNVVYLQAKVKNLESTLSRYKSVHKTLSLEQPSSTLTNNANDCCKVLNQNILEENRVLSSAAQNLKRKYEKLKDENETLNIRFADTSMQLHAYVFNG